MKIVQRLPVRIELTDYDPDKSPLFVGLSVVPYVYYKEPPTGPHAGRRLAAASADFLQGRAAASDRETSQRSPASRGQQRH